MRRLISLLGDLLFHASHSRLERELINRPQLDDRAFYQAHYADSGIPEDIPIRIRKVYVEQLGDCWKGVRPGDDACDAYPDLDFAELLYEIEDEFGIKIPSEDMKKMDGTFGAIVRYVALQQQTPARPERRVSC
jgi:acyl carrier protein